MTELRFTVLPEEEGRPVRQILRARGVSVRLMNRLKRAPLGLCLNGTAVARTIDPVRAGDTLILRIPPDDSLPEALPYPLDIVYEDADILVVNKPAGLPMHPTHNHQGDTLANAVAAYMAGQGRPCALRAAGRLDKGASGLVVCALHSFAASQLNGKVGKTYFALAGGEYEGAGTFRNAIWRPRANCTLRACRDYEEARQPGDETAVTHWEALACRDGVTLLRIRLETGRTHQIRAHFALHGTPLLGDDYYGAPVWGHPGFALHCGEAEFAHPVTGEGMRFEAEMPGYFALGPIVGPMGPSMKSENHENSVKIPARGLIFPAPGCIIKGVGTLADRVLNLLQGDKPMSDTIEKKQFQAESQRMLDLMIHSIYTHKEIFLRELISNASDAIDKRYYQALHGGETGLARDEFAISIAVDKQARLLTIADNGCGMDAAELESNLGTIARSGSLEFKKEIENAEDIDVIGQFGVGFYSAFMVADEIYVRSRKAGEDQAWQWFSQGADGFTLEPCEKDDVGTEIVLKIKTDSDDQQYDEFLEGYRIKELVKRYSDYIRYPIRMEVETSKPKALPADAPEDAEPEWESVTETQTLNSMSPIWRRNKNEVSAEDYEAFYRDTFHDYEKPLRRIHASAEGMLTYQALLFLPAKAPYNYYSKEFEKGLKLYASGVMIMERCKELLPDCFSFLRGVVDSQDLSLNISREMLQQDRQLQTIAKNLEKKIKAELKSLMEEDREAYHGFYKAFGLNLKYNLYASYGMQRELLVDLLEFPSTTQERAATFAEYIARMPEAQKYIYYATGESAAQIKRLPLCERLTELGYEVLCLTDDIDEFLMKMLHQVDDKELRSVAEAGVELESEEEKAKLEEARKEDKDLFEALKEALGGKVAEVAPTARLKSHPVCLTSRSGVSLEMERVLQSQPGAEELPPMKAERVLELNINHPVYAKLGGLEPERLGDYANLLYNQALLIEGFPVEDPVEFANAICRLMA